MEKPEKRWKIKFILRITVDIITVAGAQPKNYCLSVFNNAARPLLGSEFDVQIDQNLTSLAATHSSDAIQTPSLA